MSQVWYNNLIGITHSLSKITTLTLCQKRKKKKTAPTKVMGFEDP